MAKKAEAWVTDMVRRLSDAGFGEKSGIIAEYEALSGKSQKTLWRIARENGYENGRKTRSDAGECALSDIQVDYISGLIWSARREVKGTILSVEEALQIAEDNGIIEAGCISVARLTEILRERCMSAAHLNAPTPHISMRSLHPNHVHIFDVSVCIQYYLKNGGIKIEDERKFYKNQVKNFKKIKSRLLRYVLADHFSNTICVKYYYGQGETQQQLFDFFCFAWGGGKHEKFPFRGVPFYVLMDAGAANKSKAVLELLERMDIQMPKSMPHNPRRQGSAEGAQQIVETAFESKLRFQPATDIEQLNAWAMDWMVWFNARKRHRRLEKAGFTTRTQAWLSIKPEHLRELPERELMQAVFANPTETRVVNGRYSISFRGQEYDIRHIPGVIPGKSAVDVILRPYNFPEIGIKFNGNQYDAKPVGLTAGGFRADAAIIGEEYKAMPESLTQKAVKRAENLAYGEEKEGKKRNKAVAFAGLTVFGNRADQVNIVPLPKRGTEHELTKDRADILEKRIGVTELFKRLIPLTGRITPEMNRKIRSRYPTGLTASEANQLCEAARKGNIGDVFEDTPHMAEVRYA